MQRRLLPPAVERAPDRLAVDGHHLAFKAGYERAGPGREAGLEGLRVDQHEYAPEGVVRGNAVRQLQKGPQPVQFAAAVQGAMSSQLSAQAITAHTAITRMSVRRCSILPPQRGSATAPKCCTKFSAGITCSCSSSQEQVIRY